MNATELKSIADKVREVCIFCIEHQGKCFTGWHESKIYRYISWHLLNGTLFIIRRGEKIAAVGIAWRVKLSELLRKARNKIPPFDWGPLPNIGDATLVADIFGSRKLCRELTNLFLERWPESWQQPFFTYRQGKLHRFNLDRFFNA